MVWKILSAAANKNISRVFKRNAEVINEYTKQQWLKDRLWTPGSTPKGVG
jgi:putative SOS response-associated peptidase YedK